MVLEVVKVAWAFITASLSFRRVRVLVMLAHPRLQSSQEVAVVALLVSLIHNDLLDVLLDFAVLGAEAQHAVTLKHSKHNLPSGTFTVSPLTRSLTFL